MINLPRLFKIGLPVTTVATATAVTVSLICLYRNDDKDKRDLNNEELNDFENNLKKFEETTISYPEKPKSEGDNGTEDGEDSVEINLGAGGAVILGDVAQEGGTSLGKAEEGLGVAQSLENEFPSQPSISNLGDSTTTITSESGELSASLEDGGVEGQADVAVSNLNENSNNGLSSEGSMGEDADQSNGQADGQQTQTPAKEESLLPQMGANQHETVASQIEQNGQGEFGISAVDERDATGPVVEGVDSGGRGATQDGLDPDSTEVKESKNLEQELKMFEGLGVELKSNRSKLDLLLL